MTDGFEGTVFSAGRRFCRIGAALMLVALAGCAGPNRGESTPTGTPGAQDTGTFPNLNIAPQVAAPQLTDDEKKAKLARLEADQASQGFKGGAPNVTSKATLDALAEKHGDETLKQIESKCDPALDPNCN